MKDLNGVIINQDNRFIKQNIKIYSDTELCNIEYGTVAQKTDPGKLGDIKIDTDYIYIHNGTEWKKIELNNI